MPRERFYLMKRRDKLTEGNPACCCRLRNYDGQLLPWRSTSETSKTRAELWALKRIREAQEKPARTLLLEPCEFLYNCRVKRADLKGVPILARTG